MQGLNYKGIKEQRKKNKKREREREEGGVFSKPSPLQNLPKC